MFNAYKISTLKLEKIKYFDNFKNSEINHDTVK